MPAAKSVNELRPLCYEHHREMRLHPGFSNPGGDGTQTVVYSCTQPDCFIRYDLYRGYFLLSQNGNRNEMDILPSLRCVRDGTPLYLAEIDQEKRALRLWLCPQCGAQRSNEDDLVGATAEGVHDGKRGSPPQTSGSTPI